MGKIRAILILVILVGLDGVAYGQNNPGRLVGTDPNGNTIYVDPADLPYTLNGGAKTYITRPPVMITNPPHPHGYYGAHIRIGTENGSTLPIWFLPNGGGGGYTTTGVGGGCGGGCGG